MTSCRLAKKFGAGILARCTNSRISRIATFTTKSQEEAQPEFSTLTDDLTNELEEAKERIQQRRNKSRLSPAHYNIIHGRPPYQEPMHEDHLTVTYKRKLFGRYGRQSGVDPGTLWPTKAELEDQREYEKAAYPVSLKESIENAWEKVRQEERVVEERQAKIRKNLAKLSQWMQDVNDRAAKKLEETRVARERKEALIEEVRRHFGFKVHPNDERFKDMLAQKEKAQKKKLKEEKARLRGEKLLSKMAEDSKRSQS